MSQDATPRETTPPTRLIGCDVGKATIVVFDSRTEKIVTIRNRRADLDTFLAGVEPTALVVCEATGGYEGALLTSAVLAGVPAHRADARKVKAFIRSFGILGKTDAIDAKALVAYARERHATLMRWQPADPQRDRLQALVLARRDLVGQRTAFANRRGAPGAEDLASVFDPIIACLETQIDRLDAAIVDLVRDDDTLRRDAAALRTIPGIGAVTAAGLLAILPPPATPPSFARLGPWLAPPELGRLDRRKIAAIGGLAPHPNQSGTHDGARRVRGGRPEIRRILFMPALSAVRCDPGFRETYHRLIGNGKKPIVAIVAIMRKIVVIANARIRDAAWQTATV